MLDHIRSYGARTLRRPFYQPLGSPIARSPSYLTDRSVTERVPDGPLKSRSRTNRRQSGTNAQKRWQALMILGALTVLVYGTAEAAPLSVAGGENTRGLTFATKGAKGANETALLTVIVRNSANSAGTLRLRFIDSDGNEAAV